MNTFKFFKKVIIISLATAMIYLNATQNSILPQDTSLTSICYSIEPDLCIDSNT